jgi:hypothetical protein
MRVGISPTPNNINFRAQTGAVRSSAAAVKPRVSEVLYARRHEGAYLIYPVSTASGIADRLTMFHAVNAPLYVALPVTGIGGYDDQRSPILLNQGPEGALHQLPQNNKPQTAQLIKQLMTAERAFPQFNLHPDDHLVRDAFLGTQI